MAVKQSPSVLQSMGCRRCRWVRLVAVSNLAPSMVVATAEMITLRFTNPKFTSSQ
jgi:hypothetical protein